mgnify:CR=1 FL=1
MASIRAGAWASVAWDHTVVGRIDARRTFDYAAFKEEQYDRLADHVRRHVDMAQIYGMMKKR